ncbi:uncharacterized oxidoreductase MexAM1_META1p0182-like [Oppia nitens]|uniref:uncharacterized oxidoreductase MexAM1_META1p0182-like n=1 Tax=Oppia nitens TaxID=1686743 RepID=UPI0023D9CFF8|nr:uncharacterized oxidoreductase MexAM1_META1p0182-like [Oppia nitens]
MSLNYDFTGKVALITGSSSGIGAGIALLFSKSGANVVITGRDADRVHKVANDCIHVSPKQLQPLEVVGDITNENDCQRLVELTVRKFGQLDILVNNAGTVRFSTIDEPDYMKTFDFIMQTNLYSTVCMTHKSVPYLAKTGGNIINISSVDSKRLQSSRSQYNMSKASVNMFTKCMAAELGPKRIRVNAIITGIILTDITIHSMDTTRAEADKIIEKICEKYPVGRPGQPEDIANSVAYLASNDTAGFITGTLLVVDGGHIAANIVAE